MEQKKSTAKKRLSKNEWNQADEMWRSGGYTLVEIADKFGMNPSYLSQSFKKRGVIKGSIEAEVKRRVEEELSRISQSEVAERVARLNETLNDAYVWSKALGNLSIKLVSDCHKSGGDIGALVNPLKAINIAVNTAKVVREERFASLGIKDYEPDPGDDLPILPITEMTAEDIASVHAETSSPALPYAGDDEEQNDVED